MSVPRSEVIAFLQNTVRDILECNGQDLSADITENSRLWGKGGQLSSLMLVELMLAVEDFCAEKNLNFVWANDSTMSERRSVYRTLDSLSNFILSLETVPQEQ